MTACVQRSGLLEVLAGRFLFGVSWGSSPLGLVLVLGSYTVAVSGMATLVGALVSTPEQASGLGWISTMVMAGLGGCWWPSEVMPRWMWKLAHIFPTAWAMDGFHALVLLASQTKGRFWLVENKKPCRKAFQKSTPQLLVEVCCTIDESKMAT